MKLPTFIKQLAKVCDMEASRYALGGVHCVSDGTLAHLTATDGRILATVSYADATGTPVNSIVEGSVIVSPPVAALKAGVRFDGKALHHGGSTTSVAPIEGRFPRIEDVFDAIESEPEKYAAVKLDPALLRKLVDLAHAMNTDATAKGITLFVKDSGSAVFASCASEDGHVARMAIMPRAADGKTKHSFPARPHAAPTDTPAATQPAPKPTQELRVRYETVHADGRREPGPTVNVTTGKVEQPAPPPELKTDKHAAGAVAVDWSAQLPQIA